MSVTLGLMLRVDGFPPAVPVPPVQQGERPVLPIIIEAEKVVEVTSMARNNILGNNINHHSNASVHEQQPLTYSRKSGSGGVLPTLNGQLLDLYA